MTYNYRVLWLWKKSTIFDPYSVHSFSRHKICTHLLPRFVVLHHHGTSLILDTLQTNHFLAGHQIPHVAKKKWIYAATLNCSGLRNVHFPPVMYRRLGPRPVACSCTSNKWPEGAHGWCNQHFGKSINDSPLWQSRMTVSGWWFQPSERYEFVSWDDYSQYMEK